MKDALLQVLIDFTEKGELSGIIIWLIMPGGAISGEVVPSWRAADDLLSKMVIKGDKKTASFPEIPPDQKYAQADQEGYYQFVNLASAVYYSGQQVFNLPIVKISIDMISAWGTGLLQDGLMKSI
jgi:hypothetical protein